MKRTDIPIDPQFSTWYRHVELGENRELLARRWSGVVSLAEAASQADLEAMIRVVFRTKQPPAADALARIHAKLRESDDTLDTKGNGREVEVLLGAALATVMKSGGARGGTTALAIAATSLGGVRSTVLPFDIVSIADSVLSGPDVPGPSLSSQAVTQVPKANVEAATAEIRKWTAEAGATSVNLIAEAIRAALAPVFTKNAEILNAQIATIATQDEELQILWWLTGQRSWDEDRAFEAVPRARRPLLLAKELAALTRSTLGPRAASAILSRAGLTDGDPLTVAAAVNACDLAWLRNLPRPADPSPVTQPIHFAVARRLETGDTEAWIAGWAATSDLPADRAFAPLALGLHFYRERLTAGRTK